jgi:hypothetical protein
MAVKIVRDIGRKGSLTISLKEGDAPRPRVIKSDAVDLTSAGKRRRVMTSTGKTPPSGIKRRTENKGQVFFFRIDPEREYRLDRVNEVIRMAAAGILILFSINIVNIAQRGMVIRDSVIASASTGYESLMKATDDTVASQYRSAEDNYDEATSNFNLALQNLSFLQANSDNFFAREKTVESVDGLLKAAGYMAEAGRNFTRGIENLSKLPTLFMDFNRQPKDALTKGTYQGSLTERLKQDLAYIEKAAEQTRLADLNLARVSADVLPPQYRTQLESAKAKVKKLLEILDSAEKKIPAVLELLGDRYPHRYLILLQNDAEARPTGGFIGSFLIVDINDGYVTKMEFNDVYDFDGQLNEDIPAPEDIAKISSNWRMRDSNYSPDFAVSAEKAAWFLQKEKGPSVDTVIAVNQSLIADLLDVTGPVSMEGLNVPLDRNNYQAALSYVIEAKLNGAESPKKILGDFINVFKEKLASSGNWKKTFNVLLKACARKTIMFYSRSEDVQALFDELGLSGKVIRTQPGEDYLDVIVTSIGGNKSDLFIQQSVRHNTLVNSTGLLIDEVVVKRRHVWSDAALDELKSTLSRLGFNDAPDWIIDILGRGVNKSYVKIYVPRGSKLIEVAGIPAGNVMTRQDEEIDKTYFIFQLDTAPGGLSEVTVTYQLPQNLQLLPVATYRLHVQRQPGIRAGTFVKQVFFKPGLQGYRQYPDAFRKYENGNLYYEGLLEGDLYLSAVVGQ